MDFGWLTEHEAVKWLGAAGTAVLAALGVQKWWARRRREREEADAERKAELEARFSSKADLREIEQLHERIERHKKANDQQVVATSQAIAAHRGDIKELYGKTDALKDLLIENERRASDRFEHLLAAIKTKS